MSKVKVINFQIIKAKIKQKLQKKMKQKFFLENSFAVKAVYFGLLIVKTSECFSFQICFWRKNRKTMVVEKPC